MKKCKCKKVMVDSNYCPDCGTNLSKKENRRYPVEGRQYINKIMAVKTKEHRCPMKGEYYISGATPEAYLAYNDLDQKYWIARLLE